MNSQPVSQFTCPQCGGHTFGSTLTAGTFDITERHCNGYFQDGTSCRFTWKPADDTAYGLAPPLVEEPVVGTTLFEHVVFGDGVMTVDNEIQKYMAMPKEELAKLHNLEACTTDECLVCGVLACPKKEPLHFHHDGCPACE